ncbi:MAG: polysaccharide biosynthesis tyrosine autokinase [Verrucomicrobiales bacterium]|nr:polysaccharide biosynthesis tyrosine autokinase [Verrucomicrobiales bacterium]
MESSNQNPRPQAEFHFLDYWRIIRIRKTVILAVWLLVVLTTAAVTLVLKPTFSSTVRIEVEKDTMDIDPLGGRQQDTGFDPYFMATEFEKILSTSVLMPIITNTASGHDFIAKWTDRLGLKDGERLTLDEAYAYLRRNVDVDQSRNTKLVELTVFSPEKQEAADLANLIVESYKGWRERTRLSYVNSAIKVLQDQEKEQDKKVAELQAEVEELRERDNIPDSLANSATGYQASLEREQLSVLLQALTRAQADRVFYTAKLDELEAVRKEGDEGLRQAILTVVSGEQILPGLMQDFNVVDQTLTKLQESYSDEHPQVKEAKALKQKIQDQIASRVDGMMEGLRANVKAADANYNMVSNQVAQVKSEVAAQAGTYSEYFEKKRDLENQQRIRDAVFLRKLQEGIDAKLPTESIVKVVDHARPARRPVRPNITINLGLGIVFGLIMGIALAFFIEYLDTSVKTIDDVERAMDAAVVGVIPQNVGLLVRDGPDSPHAEAYRVLRTNVLFSRKEPSANTVTVVSGGAGEGKSTTIFNLATVFAQNGERVLLVDSDLRRPSLHKFLNVSNSVGLTNFLLKQNTMEEVIQTTSMATLDFLPSGKLPSSALGILNSARMKEFVDEVRSRYDFVFFDSPPIMGVSDASILTSVVDMTLLVIQYRKYPQAMTLRAKQMVQKVGGTLLGIVLNNINISQDSYYYYYSGYYYDYYYGSSSKSSKGRKRRSKPGSSGKDRGGKAPRPDADADSEEAVEIKQKF